MPSFPPNFARKIALLSPHPRYQHAAIVLRGGAVLSVGYNHDGRHAEVVALSKLWPSKRRGTTLLSIRVGLDGKFTMAKPCYDCERFCTSNKVSRVFYSNRSGEMERLG